MKDVTIAALRSSVRSKLAAPTPERSIRLGRFGTSARVVRRAGPRKLEVHEEITEFAPAKSWTVRGTGGPLTATARTTIEPLDDGHRSRVEIKLGFDAKGVGTATATGRPMSRRRLMQTGFFWRNAFGIGACIVFFGMLVTLGDGLRYAITVALFNF